MFAALVFAAFLACDLTPPPRAMREPDTTDNDDPAALMPEPHKAEGALTQVTFVVKGRAADRYRRALERALGRADIHVVDFGNPSDMEIELDVDGDEEAVALENEATEEEIDKELIRYHARMTVLRGGQPIASIESSPRFELRTVTYSGNVLSTKRSLDQADIEFCGAGMNGLATKLVHSAAVNEAATAAKASTPPPSADAGAGAGDAASGDAAG